MKFYPLTLTLVVVFASCGDDAIAPISSQQSVGIDAVCYPNEENNYDCGGGPEGGDPCPNCVGIAIGGAMTNVDCRASGLVDQDYDGVVDLCEYYLAAGFKPAFKWDSGDDYLNREPYWAVRPLGTQSYRIFYAIGYHMDGGDPWVNTWAHTGDSEHVIVDVTFDNLSQRWITDQMYTSAHAGMPNSQSRWTTFEHLTYGDNHWRGRPNVWVANNKHANYASQSECLLYELCNGLMPGSLQILQDANLGNNLYRLVDYVLSRTYPNPPGGVAFWSGLSFCGWQSEPCSTTNYSVFLSQFGM
jgi:hypothetical protein